MSRLREMIKDMCPDGVEYRWFEDCCEYVRGITYNKSNEARSDSEPVWRVLRANNITLSSNTLNFDDVKLIEKTVRVKEDQFLTKGDILICAGSGSKEHIGKVAYIDEDMEYTFGGFMAVIRCNSSIDSRYLFHIFTSKLFLLYLDTALNSSTINNLNFTVMKKFIFPVPPLPIQNEIVKLLDNFTELTAELTAELLLRKKQYNFYRDGLLNFVRVDDTIVQTERQTALRIGKIGLLQQSVAVEWKTLGEVCDLIAGGDVPKGEFSQVVTEEYRIPIYSNGIGEKALYGFTKSPRITQPCVTISARGTIGYSALHLTPFYPVVRLIAAIPYKCLDVKYLFYMLQMTTFKIPQTGIPQLTIPMVKTYPIPIPPLEVQEKIVSILDRFDTLCNDLTQGLLAEIAARKKQYEYYRDKLLTFPRKAV